jgi:hypothetical protein
LFVGVLVSIDVERHVRQQALHRRWPPRHNTRLWPVLNMIYIYVHACIHVYTHTRICTRTRTRTRACTCTHTRCACARARTHTNIIMHVFG